MRPRTAILIPVKSAARAKGRLAALLDQSARQRLSLAMLEDVLAAVIPAIGNLVDGVFVATTDPEAMAIARTHGATVLPEQEQRSESHSVDAASMLLAGSLYRFNAFLVGYSPGPGWTYFPALPEILITLSIVALELMGYLYFVKRYPVLPKVEHV